MMTGTEYRQKREALGMNQTQLAQALGVSRRTIVRLEGAREVPTTDEFALNFLLGMAVSMSVSDAR